MNDKIIEAKWPSTWMINVGKRETYAIKDRDFYNIVYWPHLRSAVRCKSFLLVSNRKIKGSIY